MTHYLPARATDPLTSWESAEHITTSGKAKIQRAIAVSVVRKYPGMTSFELTLYCALDRYQLARRLPECGEVKKGPARNCLVTGRNANTWLPVHSAEGV